MQSFHVFYVVILNKLLEKQPSFHSEPVSDRRASFVSSKIDVYSAFLFSVLYALFSNIRLNQILSRNKWKIILGPEHL